MLDPRPDAVARDPAWLPHSFDPSGAQLTFVHVPRESQTELMFLTDDHYRERFAKVTLPAAELARHASDAARAPLHFIWHTAFCGSTLLVKALDRPGRVLGLKEPQILINVANRLVRSDDPGNRQRLDLVLRLLARPQAAGETVIVKPGNVANSLAGPALHAVPEAKAVPLHSDLPTFLRSVAKRGIWGRIWARQAYRTISQSSPIRPAHDEAERFDLTDLQVAGLAWLVQIQQFGGLARNFGDRVLVVDSEDFLAAPAATLASCSNLFGLALKGAEIEEIVAGPVFSRHSKFSQLDYSLGQREAETDAVAQAHREEIETVVKWVDAMAAHFGVSTQILK